MEYEMRKLQATDLFSVVKILNGIGLKNVREAINIEEINDLLLKYDDVCLVSNSELNINNYIVNKVSYDVLNIVNYYMGEEEIDAHNLKSNYLKLPQAVCDHNDKWS